MSIRVKKAKKKSGGYTKIGNFPKWKVVYLETRTKSKWSGLGFYVDPMVPTSIPTLNFIKWIYRLKVRK